jgi:hypothetical protein
VPRRSADHFPNADLLNINQVLTDLPAAREPHCLTLFIMYFNKHFPNADLLNINQAVSPRVL